LSKLSKVSNNSEHILLYNLFKYISNNKSSGMFNLELYDMIENAYNKQIDKLEQIYSKYDYVLNDITKKKETKTNIIASFCYGYKTNRAFKTNNNYKFNDLKVDLSKCYFKKDFTEISSISSIIFYTNIYIQNKLNIMICSPYIETNKL
jgi:hypothetical protein